MAIIARNGYARHIWKTNDIVTAERLNNIEEGISDLWGFVGNGDFTIDIENGGTGADNLYDARANLGFFVSVTQLDDPTSDTDPKEKLSGKQTLQAVYDAMAITTQKNKIEDGQIVYNDDGEIETVEVAVDAEGWFLNTDFVNGQLPSNTDTALVHIYRSNDGERGYIEYYKKTLDISDRKCIGYKGLASGTTLQTNWFFPLEGFVLKTGDTMTGQLHIEMDSDRVPDSTNKPAPLVIGKKNLSHLELDENEIQARGASAASTLYLQANGGTVQIGQTGTNYDAANLTVIGNETITGQIYINNSGDKVPETNLNKPPLVIGNKDSNHVEFDDNEIEAHSASGTDTLYLQANGGIVSIGIDDENHSTANLKVTGNLTVGGAAIVETLNASQAVITNGSKQLVSRAIKNQTTGTIASDASLVTANTLNYAISTLDVEDTPVNTQYVSGVSETDGKITVTRTNFPNITIAGKTISTCGGTITPAELVSSLGLSSALKYKGIVPSLPSAADAYSDYNSGDVVSYNNREYVYVKGTSAANSSWNELGDESSYALKTIKINGHTLDGDVTVTKSDVGLSNVTNDAQVKASLGTTKGDMLYWSAANTPARLGIGADGYILTVNNGLPAWQSTTTITSVGTITSGTWKGTAIASDYIGNLPASKITTGTFNAARIPNLDASKITTGTISVDRIPVSDIASQVSSSIGGDFVKKTGDTMTGDLVLYKESTASTDLPAQITFSVKDTEKNSTFSAAFIRTYHDHNDSYGGNMVIQSGGGVFIGGGESPNLVYKEAVTSSSTGYYNSEHLFLTSDNWIHFDAYCNVSDTHPLTSRVGMVLTNSHTLTPTVGGAETNNVGSIGSSNYKWNAVYATTFNGNVTGNVSGSSGSCTGNAATATRINGNLGAISSATNCNIWVSSTGNADGIPKYVSGVYVTASTGVLTAKGFAGPLTGNVTGNVSGTAANVTGVVGVEHGGTGASTANANYVFAAPSNSNGAPAFRKLVAADIPALSYLPLTGGTLTNNLYVSRSSYPAIGWKDDNGSFAALIGTNDTHRIFMRTYNPNITYRWDLYFPAPTNSATANASGTIYTTLNKPTPADIGALATNGTASYASVTNTTSETLEIVGVTSSATTTLKRAASSAASLSISSNEASLQLGTSSSSGAIRLHTSSNGNHYIEVSDTASSRDHTLPDASGWLVTSTFGTAVGSATQPVYVNASGVATAGTNLKWTRTTDWKTAVNGANAGLGEIKVILYTSNEKNYWEVSILSSLLTTTSRQFFGTGYTSYESGTDEEVYGYGAICTATTTTITNQVVGFSYYYEAGVASMGSPMGTTGPSATYYYR